MISETYQRKPLPAELETITLSQQLVNRLHESYAWVAVAGEQPFASLISPAGTDEEALYHFIDNATLNHHRLSRFMNHPVTAEEVLGSFQTDEVVPVAEQYLGSYLLQQSQRNDLLLPMMNVLSLANYDVIGVFAAMVTPQTESLSDTLIEMTARLLARLAPNLITLDHVPDEADYILPPHLLIAIEDTQGNPSDIPVALLDWLPDHLTQIKTLADGDQNGLLNLLNEQTDDGSTVVRDWLIRNDDNQQIFSQWIFQHREQVK
ncbi:hypothetical protein HC026_03830 [Lactobacillus sp. LC28-10]|uniref:Uncharacterized protein n=1 Tax=Secundilactobacillus angelensis TaxID=2722706 RepID=A0ABX1L165_9LACO|nr:hypothetical protein [Secundilactobacillus angelensis]MCH5462467.1 hypothetical protein [Secundilactobacillus angelensis]NLR18051.1 hypothetical protein [Secundilactobacillus angelensis]